MTAQTQRFLKVAQILKANAQPRIKTEFEFIKEAIVGDKASRSGVMKLAWYYIKKKGLSFKVAVGKAWEIVKEKIERSIKDRKIDLSAWGVKFD